MANIVLDSEILRLMNYFKDITRVSCRDCFEFNNIIVFVTNANEAGLAIGREGVNKQLLEKKLHKRVKIFGAAESPEGLVKNFMLPVVPENVSLSEDGSVVNIKFVQSKERRILLSQNLERLKLLKTAMARYFPKIMNIMVLQ